jgi:xylan 1,4-beta-xylosidase
MKNNFLNCVRDDRARTGLSALHLFFFCACVCTGLAQPRYQNPVIPGDHPDPSIIRVGKDYWATSTSSEWGPQFPLLHSTDLVNWENMGSVFPHRPEWATANFWAPEISEYKGHYFVYYVGRKQNGPLAVAVATAEKPGGPYTDHGPLVAQDAGSIDPAPVIDENGRRYLIWKEDGNSRKRPAIIWAQPLADNGAQLTGEPQELLRNDAPWEGAVIEGPFVLRRGDWFYLFYSGGACCGRECNYGLGVTRAHNLLGPWEKHPANPILMGNAGWKCPGHGSIVADEKGRYWLLYHGYSTTNFVFTGREALLDEVRFETNAWPAINQGAGPTLAGVSPLGGPQKRKRDFVDDFKGSLLPGWEWPQDQEPSLTFTSQSGGGVTLSPKSSRDDSLLAAVLGRATTSGSYTALATIALASTEPHAMAGIAAIGDVGNAAGLAVGNGKLLLWRRDKGTQKTIFETAAVTSGAVQLRLIATDGSNFQFSFRSDGKPWTPVGPAQSGERFPPWDRSIRVGLTVGGVANAAGVFRQFNLTDQ